MRAGDIDFILSSWARSYRNSFFAQNIPNPIYFDEHKKIIARSLKNSWTMVAYLDGDEDLILGYIVYDPNAYRNILIVHYLYVKQVYRGFGVGERLMTKALEDAEHSDELPIIATHTNSNFKKFYPDNFVYNPYLLMGKA